MDLAKHFQSSDYDTEQINRLYFISSNANMELWHKLECYFLGGTSLK